MSSSSSDEELVLVAAQSLMFSTGLIINAETERRRRVRRLHWVKPWRENIAPVGNIQYLMKEYRLFADYEAIKKFLGMNESSFLEILSMVRGDIERRDTSMRKCIPVEEKLSATLRRQSHPPSTL